MRVVELFAGIGACSKALKNIGIDVEIVDAVEIDKYAIKSFNAINNTNFDIQDIRYWNKEISNIDFITHGSPCQDFSIAGKQKGGDLGSGTRSSLMYEAIRIIEEIKPKYVLWENVKNILSKKHKHNFVNYINTLNNIGYNSYYQVLNSKDFGIPQNRERVYTISIRKDIDKSNFIFPVKEELKIKLKDMLQDEVDEKYYLSDKMKDYVLDNNNTQKGTKWECRTDSGIVNPNIAHALSVRGASGSQRAGISNFVIDNIEDEIKVKDLKIKIKNATKKGYLEAGCGDGIDISYRMKYHRGTVQKQTIQTITTSGGNDRGVVVYDDKSNSKNFKIRKLTPLECWRLMGFEDNDFYKAKEAGISNTQLYKQAGNSIVVKVLEKIFINLLNDDGGK